MSAAAAEAYERIAARTLGPYPTQNAALLWTLAGEEARAIRLAARVTDSMGNASGPHEEDLVNLW